MGREGKGKRRIGPEGKGNRGGGSRHRLARPLAYGPIIIAIRARFEYDSSTIQHPTRSYVLSSNNEHVNSFALL